MTDDRFPGWHGTTILAVAFIDELVLELRGRRVQATSGEMLRNE